MLPREAGGESRGAVQVPVDADRGLRRPRSACEKAVRCPFAYSGGKCTATTRVSALAWPCAFWPRRRWRAPAAAPRARRSRRRPRSSPISPPGIGGRLGVVHSRDAGDHVRPDRHRRVVQEADEGLVRARGAGGAWPRVAPPEVVVAAEQDLLAGAGVEPRQVAPSPPRARVAQEMSPATMIASSAVTFWSHASAQRARVPGPPEAVHGLPARGREVRVSDGEEAHGRARRTLGAGAPGNPRVRLPERSGIAMLAPG